MTNFLLALSFAPVVFGLLWIYMSPLSRLDGFTFVKVIIRVALFFLTMGGLFAQLGFIAQRVPMPTRRIYILALLIIEGIPMLGFMFYRVRQNPSLYGACGK